MPSSVVGSRLLSPTWRPLSPLARRGVEFWTAPSADVAIDGALEDLLRGVGSSLPCASTGSTDDGSLPRVERSGRISRYALWVAGSAARGAFGRPIILRSEETPLKRTHLPSFETPDAGAAFGLTDTMSACAAPNAPPRLASVSPPTRLRASSERGSRLGPHLAARAPNVSPAGVSYSSR